MGPFDFLRNTGNPPLFVPAFLYSVSVHVPEETSSKCGSSDLLPEQPVIRILIAIADPVFLRPLLRVGIALHH